MKGLSNYKKDYNKKVPIPNDKMQPPSSRLKAYSIDPKNGTTYGNSFVGEPTETPAPIRQADNLKPSGESAKLTSYKSDYPGYPGFENPIVIFVLC